MKTTDEPDARLDPIFVSSCRESKWILIAWLVNFTWVVGYCVSRGYQDAGDVKPLQTLLGMPSWVFWGVFLPWILATAFTAWFALTRMADHPLGDDPPRENTDE